MTTPPRGIIGFVASSFAFTAAETKEREEREERERGEEMDVVVISSPNTKYQLLLVN